jgi:signal transduction histidine kinase
VQVRCRPAGDRVRLEIDDTGPGIAPADRDRVFDRFFRHPNAQAGGTGLGLAIVRAIAIRHGAEVSLGESPTGGLRVTLNVPRAS